MDIHISKPKALKKDGHYGFNVFLHTEGYQMVLVGFRVVNGYINPPAMITRGKYYGVAYFDPDLSLLLYEALEKELPGTLKSFDRVKVGFGLTEDRAKMYMPGLTPGA